MTPDPRAALAVLVSALERHLEAAASRRDPDDPTVTAAAQDLAEAFDAYDEALFDSTEVATPLAIYDGPFEDDDSEDEDDEDDDEDEDDDDDEDLDDDDDDDTGIYSGLEDVDLDDDSDDVNSEDEDDDPDDEDEDDEEPAGVTG